MSKKLQVLADPIVVIRFLESPLIRQADGELKNIAEAATDKIIIRLH